MNIVLVDDHALVRAGIRTLIDQIDSFRVVGEASGNAEALALVEQLQPDVVVTDLTMGQDSGLDLLRDVHHDHPDLPVVILSMHASEEMVAEGLRLGAAAYLLKEAAPSELEIALQAIKRKETYLSPAVSTKVIQQFVRPTVAEKATGTLTARQLQILTMIANRKSTKEIAYELDLSEKTIAAHRAQIMERTGVRDLVGLVFYAVKHGLVKQG
ncbi:response regulator [Pseudoduganella armeniaca]|uniref:DNA-binding response regulator n=1 Tax=Pseudoduganella armeniaca TaxID=2072590 RepID=A0A2R4CGP4_9BURK|nr:response regulator transcription factor [Pseudoduganella armeniaca]AVR98628.1 DNA-binding response regulator [Pseudoduganella armeniaca]